MNNNTLLVKYCIFPYTLETKTLGEVKEWMEKKKATESDIQKFETLLSSNPTKFVSIDISQKDNIIPCPYKYRVKQLSWWERNFVYDDKRYP